MVFESGAGRFLQVELHGIDLKERLFVFAFPEAPDDTFVAGIREYGIMVPPVLQERQAGGFRVVSGHRRLAGAVEAGLATVSCRVVGREIDDKALYFRQVRDNALTRPVNDLERAGCLDRLVSRFQAEDKEITEIMALLGLASGRRILEQYLGLARLSADLARYMVDHAIPIRVSSRIAGYGPGDQSAVSALLREVQLGGSRLKGLLDLVEEIALREKSSVAAVLQTGEIRAILDESRWTGTQKREKLKEALVSIRYPMLSERIGEITALIKEAGPLPRGSIAAPPYLEGTALQAAFSFASIEELRESADRLAAAAGSRSLARVLRLLQWDGEE